MIKIRFLATNVLLLFSRRKKIVENRFLLLTNVLLLFFRRKKIVEIRFLAINVWLTFFRRNWSASRRFCSGRGTKRRESIWTWTSSSQRTTQKDVSCFFSITSFNDFQSDHSQRYNMDLISR